MIRYGFKIGNHVKSAAAIQKFSIKFQRDYFTEKKYTEKKNNIMTFIHSHFIWSLWLRLGY